MLRSMFAGVSGLRSHQTMMDVTGNNIANVNTTGYKSSRTTFQETLVQVARGGTAGTATQGGVNPLQIGLGSKVGATDTVFGQGASQLTGRATDVAIQGDGFFVVANSNGERFYTRSGAFSFDSEGNLVTPNGEQVLDTAGAAITVDFDIYSDISIGKDGSINGRQADGTITTIASMGLARFPNPGGLRRIGDSLYQQGPNSGDPSDLSAPGAPGFGSLQAGTLEMSNVDLAQEFTNLIMAQRGFQANSRVITSSDEILQDLVNIKR